MSKMPSRFVMSVAVMITALLFTTNAMAQTPPAVEGPPTPAAAPPVEDSMANFDKRLSLIEEWKATVERLPSLSNKVNFGLNALQFLYTHQDAKVAEGRSQDNFGIRRSELLAYGKINEFIPKWHVLFEFQSINLANNTPDCSGSPGGNCAAKAGGVPTAGTWFRESYIDFRPFPNLAPHVNFIRMGTFRMPFGIFTETSGGLRDVISSPYLTSVGSGAQNNRGTGGPIEFVHERDYFIDMRGTLFHKLDYVGGIMNNNNYTANITGANGPKVGYGRLRYFLTDISFVSFTFLAGESNNTGTFINGRGKGEFDRFAVDFRYTSRLLPGFMIQGEAWTGHDGSNATTVGAPAQGACLDIAQCGGSGAPGAQRRTWYLLAKYLISDGPLRNFEPVVMYEQFDPNTKVSNDMYTRTIIGLNYYFENLPPKIQTKLMINYEFRDHQGTGPGTTVANTDAFANNAFLVQFQVRYQ